MAVVLARLKEQRLSSWLTQLDLARKAGVTEGTVCRLERGCPARLSTVRRLAKALDLTPDDLVAPTTHQQALRAIS